jgi:hypothetical protein
MQTGQYVGGIWLEGSPTVEETMYWLSLLVDTPVPLVGCASQRPHGAAANDGDRNIIDAVRYLVSRIWADAEGRDRTGAVLVQDQRVFAAREVQKADARPGGYTATGGHGGVVGTAGDPAGPTLTFIPARRHTHTSAVNMTQLPNSVRVACLRDGRPGTEEMPIRDADGALLPSAIPAVSVVKVGSYRIAGAPDEPQEEAAFAMLTESHLREGRLAAFVGEGLAPYGNLDHQADAALHRAVLSGLPVVKVGRGNADGFTPPADLFVGGGNLTATKARLLLMACLLRLGSLPPASDPDHPTPSELEAIRAGVAEYQAVFDTH